MVSVFRRRLQLPVTPEQQSWLEDSFALLTALFGAEKVKNAPLVLPSEVFFPRKWVPTEEWASFAFERVCEIMNVDIERVELVFELDSWHETRRLGTYLGRTSGAAGTYRHLVTEEGPSRAAISIKSSLFSEPETMIAVMAHELCHVLLLGDNKIRRDMERMEPLTDLMTVFCGFGVFSANSAHVRKVDSSGWMESAHGYLTQREFGYALALFAWTRGEVDADWRKELTKNVNVFMRDTLSMFRASTRPM